MSVFISPLGICLLLVEQVDCRALGILQLWGKGNRDLTAPPDQRDLDRKRSPAPPSYKETVPVLTYVPSASRHVQAPRGRLSKHRCGGLPQVVAGSFSSTAVGVDTAQNIF